LVWGQFRQEKKYYLVSWLTICKSKSQGGLGLIDLKRLNQSLLAKWWVRFQDPNISCKWKSLILAKYGPTGFSSTCSPFWRGILKGAHVVNTGLARSLGNGLTILFWKDRWCSEHTLASLYPTLFLIAQDPDLLVSEALAHDFLDISFTRQLTGVTFHEWHNLLSHLNNCRLNPLLNDTLLWRWSSIGKFTVHSYYMWLEYGGIPNFEFTFIWSSKIPLKIKKIFYLLKRNKLLTKENLSHRGWIGNTSCPFCGSFESTDHLFVHCPFSFQIWNWIAQHNNFMFEGSTMDDIWFINASIPLKDKPLIELVRGAVLWCL
jgi:hypothetical protein